MSIERYVNVGANLLVAIYVALFLAQLMRDHPHNPVTRMTPFCRAWLRGALGCVAAAALSNAVALHFSTDSEMIKNCGLAALFAWAYNWHKVRWAQGGHD